MINKQQENGKSHANLTIFANCYGLEAIVTERRKRKAKKKAAREALADAERLAEVGGREDGVAHQDLVS